VSVLSSFYIRSAVLKPFSELLEELGADPLAVVKAAGVASELLREPELLISHQDFLPLLEEAVRATGCEHFGLLLGERNSLQSLGLLGLLLRSAPTFKVALQEMISHLQVHARGIIRTLHSDAGVAYITTDFESPEVAESLLAIQMSVATLWKIGQLLCHHLCQPTSICFTFSEPQNKVFYRRFFKAPVVFNADFNGIVFHAADLNMPLREHDPYLHQEMKRQLGKQEEAISGDLVAEVKNIIRQNLEVGICSLEATARFFPFQQRAFQKKLKRAGTCYQYLVDEIRFQRAEFHLLKSDITLSQLADLLCYKSVSVFSTAFKNRYGVAPSVWKVAHQEDRTTE